jgi:hypothetical protein
VNKLPCFPHRGISKSRAFPLTAKLMCIRQYRIGTRGCWHKP